MAGGDGGAGPGAGLGRRWDVALSFAGAQREYVERVAAALEARGVRCFYDLVLFQNQAGKWNAAPGLTPAQRAAVGEYEAAIGELRRLNAEVLAAAEQLKPVTIEALLAKSDLEAGIEALLLGWPGTGLSSNGTGQWRSSGTASHAKPGDAHWRGMPATAVRPE